MKLPLFILLSLLVASAAHGASTSITYAAQKGPGAGRHLVFLTGDEEYRGEEGLPAIEVGPREILGRAGRRHTDLRGQRRRCHGARGGGGRSRSRWICSRSVPAAMARAIVVKPVVDSSSVSPAESTMRQRQSGDRGVENASTFTLVA